MSSGTLETGIEHKNSSLYRSAPCSIGCLAWNSSSSSPPSPWQPQPSPQISKMLSRGYPLPLLSLRSTIPGWWASCWGRLQSFHTASRMQSFVEDTYEANVERMVELERERQSPRYLLSSWILICLTLDLTSVLPSLHEHKISFLLSLISDVCN